MPCTDDQEEGFNKLRLQIENRCQGGGKNHSDIDLIGQEQVLHSLLGKLTQVEGDIRADSVYSPLREGDDANSAIATMLDGLRTTSDLAGASVSLVPWLSPTPETYSPKLSGVSSSPGWTLCKQRLSGKAVTPSRRAPSRKTPFSRSRARSSSLER